MYNNHVLWAMDDLIKMHLDSLRREAEYERLVREVKAAHKSPVSIYRRSLHVVGHWLINHGLWAVDQGLSVLSTAEIPEPRSIRNETQVACCAA